LIAVTHSERLHFRIGLSGTYWRKRPIYSVLINDSVHECREVTAPSDEIFYIEFDRDIIEGAGSLKIRLENKDNLDTVQNHDRTEIVQDLLLNIHSVEIDDINLGNLIWTHTEFTPQDPTRPILTKCVNLGWNGTWSLPFNSPFYIWLLENI
jgi:hypothetical protein